MASLRNIMNVDVDDDHVDSHTFKDAGSRPSQHSDSSSIVSGTYGRGPEYSLDMSPSRNHRTNPSASSFHSLPVDQQSLAMPYNHLATRNPSDGRQGNTSNDSMDSHHGQGHRHGHHQSHTGSFSNAPLRPYVPQQEVPVKLTPITGRVSRAKKGVPVHTCDMCRPPKTFTRAEHLRRHQLSHQPPDLPCTVPGCDKVFHRRDLLERHQQRHDQDDRVGRSNSGAQARSPYNPGGGRIPSHTTGSPPGSFISMQQSYGQASPTATGSSMSMGSGHWPTHKSTPVHLHQDNTDISMEGVKDEYLLDPVSAVQAMTASAAPDFSQPRSMPGIPSIEPVQNICASAVLASTLAWPAATAIMTATTQAAFSSPNMFETSSRRPALPLSYAGWAEPVDQETPRGMTNSMGATSNGFTIPYTYGHALPPSFTSMYNEELSVGCPGYDANPALFGAHIPTPAVRSLSPQFVFGQASETMVTIPALLPADRVVNALAYGGEPSSRLAMLSRDLLPVSLSREALSALPTYMDIYWDKVHPLYPIIHRATVEDGANSVSEEAHILRCAMAAVATQFLGHRDHRINGSQLHAYASQKLKACTESSARWTLPTTQCILLCEYYARFRGRYKDDYQPSCRFRIMYQMISNRCSGPMPKLAGTKSQRWAAWINIESCRRLLSACFLLSVHGMCYYEQPYSSVLGLEKMMCSKIQIPLSGSTTRLWEARSAEAWAGIDMSTVKLTTVGDVMQEQRSSNIERPAFDVSLVIAAHAVRLPTRQNRQEVELVQDVSSFRSNDLPMFQYFSHRPGATTYLALHYTPLHDLLAVSGDSWVFNKKILDIKIFADHKRRLGEWRNSGTSAIATVFAARAIRDFLNLSSDEAGQAASMARPTHGVAACKDISDFWGLYVCTLICWAFGHVGKRPCAEKRGLSAPARDRAVHWIQAAANMEPGHLQASSGREDSQAIVGFVRDILEKECLVGRNMLLADSVGALRKLEETDNWSWF
ncbi:hypothetical protein E4U41_007025 [Claviceps citrina]|nr:hypothetical protein E4U41_007025 [Claviceps citrina]